MAQFSKLLSVQLWPLKLATKLGWVGGNPFLPTQGSPYQFVLKEVLKEGGCDNGQAMARGTAGILANSIAPPVCKRRVCRKYNRTKQFTLHVWGTYVPSMVLPTGEAICK